MFLKGSEIFHEKSNVSENVDEKFKGLKFSGTLLGVWNAEEAWNCVVENKLLTSSQRKISSQTISVYLQEK